MGQLDLFKGDADEVISDVDDTGKVCNTCEEWKPLTEYLSASPGGSHKLPDCRLCYNHAQVVRRKLRATLSYPDETYACPVCTKTAEQIQFKTQKHRKVWCLDHDHKTDEFRGWICFRCNIAAGQVRDDPDTAYRLFQYLEQSTQKQTSHEQD